MYKNYAMISCSENMQQIKFSNPLIKYYPNKYIMKYILKKLPLNVSEVDYLDNKGLEIKLPILPSIFNEEEYIKAIIEEFNDKLLIYNINVIILSKELQNYRNDFKCLIADEKHVQFLYINKVIEQVINLIAKELKDMNFVIIDGDNSKTRYIIDNIYKDINSLTVITSHPESYEEIVEEIYDDTGLAVQITNYNVNQNISSDIIINCNQDNDKVFYCFSEGSYIIDFVSNENKIRNMMIKRSDINIVTNIDMYVNNHLISKDLFHGVLLNENRIIRSIYLYGYRDTMFDRLNTIKNKYNITIGKMYQRGEEIH
jgi:hypothetical protein